MRVYTRRLIEKWKEIILYTGHDVTKTAELTANKHLVASYNGTNQN